MVILVFVRKFVFQEIFDVVFRGSIFLRFFILVSLKLVFDELFEVHFVELHAISLPVTEQGEPF